MTRQANIDAGRWWDFPLSLVEGCTPVSPGCAHCWGAAFTARFTPKSEFVSGKAFSGKVAFHPERLAIPTKSLKRGEAHHPATYAIWMDFYHEGITDAQRIEALRAIAQDEKDTFVILTKRAKAILALEEALAKEPGAPWPLDNVWLMVTVESQDWAKERMEALANSTAAHKGISAEPLLGPLALNLDGIGFIAAGPETGGGKRPCDPAWIRALYDQCQAQGVAFFDKTKKGPLAREIPWNPKGKEEASHDE